MPRATRDPHRNFAEVVGALYEAATDATLWPAFLDRFNAATGSSVATIHLHDARSDRVAPFGGTVGCDPAMESDYVEYYASRNVYMIRSVALMQTGFVGVGAGVIPLSEVKRTEYYDGWLRRLGVLDAMSACIFREDSVLAKLDFLRPLAAPSYGPSEIEFTTSLLPHLQRATSIHRRLHSANLQQAGAEQALDALAFGVCLLDQRGRSTFVNRAAERLLGMHDGLALDAAGRLTAARPAERARIERLVGEACATGAGVLEGAGPAGGTQVARPSGRRAFTVIVAPLRVRQTPLLPRVPVAVAFLSDTEREIDAATLLQEIYGLTRAEAVVATLLVEGLKVDEITERLAVSTATVRTHLRRVLEKTEARGQSDLIRILLSGPGALLLRGD